MNYDAVIVGGGAVGLSLALALGEQNLKVMLIEQQAPKAAMDDFDARTIALSFASKEIFDCLGVWPLLRARAIPIHDVVVSVKGHYGRSRLKTPDNYDALGYVVGAQDIEVALEQALAKTTVSIVRPAHITQQESNQDHWQIRISNLEQPVTCKLLIACDGANSHLRQQQRIDTITKDYHHYAVITNVEIPDLPKFTAIERFLDDGAIALLPWQQKLATCVWTVSQEKMNELKMLDDNAFLALCAQQIGRSLGKLTKCSARKYFPLNMSWAQMQVSARFLLMGNAAHNLHPIAAQGFNLSLRDIWQLRSQVVKSKQALVDIGTEAFLNCYLSARKGDQNRIIFATDKIARFMSGGPIPSMLRAKGLTLFDNIKPLKYQFIKIAMGLGV